MKKQYVKVDSRNRICLTKILKNIPDIFRVYVKGNSVILEPIQEIPDREKWLFEPQNKGLLERLRDGLQQEDAIDLGSFSQYLDND